MDLLQIKKGTQMSSFLIYDPTQTRTEIDRLGGDCPIQLCYRANNLFNFLTISSIRKGRKNHFLRFPLFF